LNDKDGKKIRNIHYSYSKPGAIRGNHYHKHKIEWLCVTFGTGRIVLEDNVTKERKEFEMNGDSPVLVKIPSNVAHAIENCDPNIPMHLLVMINEEFSSTDSDTYPRQVIFPKSQ
jgi:UDP-2-acetamido-2,6-beta-L-arabino-hexul-4-ose reductase